MVEAQGLDVTPLGDVFFVLPKGAGPEASPAGLVSLADVEYTPETCGLVVKVGTSFRCEACDERRPASVAVGEWVLFGRGAGGEVTLAGVTYLVLQESEILAVLEDGAAVAEVK
jgi:chaperonin GroES